MSDPTERAITAARLRHACAVFREVSEALASKDAFAASVIADAVVLVETFTDILVKGDSNDPPS